MSTAKRLIIGLTGPIGSGVTTVSQILAKRGFARVSLSEPIKQAFLKSEGLPPETPVDSVSNSRMRLQDIGDDGRKQSLSHWIDLAMAAAPPDRDVVLDSIRNPGEIEAIRANYPNTFVVAVVADKSVRWERVRAERYHNSMSDFERDDERDSADKDDRPYGQQVGRCVNEADYVLLNGNDLGSKERRDRELAAILMPDVTRMRGKADPALIREPTQEEIHMTEAYTLSHRSRCLKRYVGAVIVGPTGIPLSSGFNENPEGMDPCVKKYHGHCFKDDLMHDELERLQHLYCPKCGTKNVGLAKPWACTNPACRENLKLRLYPSRNMEKCTALHAEERAIRSLNGRSAEKGTMFVTTFPCLQCSRYIVDAGLKRVVYVEAYPVKESAEYLATNGVNVEPFQGFKARAFNLVFKPVS